MLWQPASRPVGRGDRRALACGRNLPTIWSPSISQYSPCGTPIGGRSRPNANTSMVLMNASGSEAANPKPPFPACSYSAEMSASSVEFSSLIGSSWTSERRESVWSRLHQRQIRVIASGGNHGRNPCSSDADGQARSLQPRPLVQEQLLQKRDLFRCGPAALQRDLHMPLSFGCRPTSDQPVR